MVAKSSVRFASINIEGHSHLETVVAFLNSFEPDIVCFQELIRDDVQFFESTLGMKGHFAPMLQYHTVVRNAESPFGLYGIGLFSKLPLANVHADIYYGDSTKDIPKFILGDETTTRRVLLGGTVSKNGELYTVATTHFTRTSDGSTSDKQRQDLKNLLAITEKHPELILCGDFNSPRGGEIFGILADKYTDNIPPEYQSSLDSRLHQLRDSKKLMVDGLFTTPQYDASNVKLSEGVSDHKAVTAVIRKVA